MLSAGNQPARHIGMCRAEPDRVGSMLVLFSFSAEGVQFGKPPLVARAPGGDAIAQPILLRGNLAAELVLLDFLLLQDRVAPRLECGEPLIQSAGDAAVEPHGRVREP